MAFRFRNAAIRAVRSPGFRGLLRNSHGMRMLVCRLVAKLTCFDLSPLDVQGRNGVESVISEDVDEADVMIEKSSAFGFGCFCPTPKYNELICPPTAMIR